MTNRPTKCIHRKSWVQNWKLNSESPSHILWGLRGSASISLFPDDSLVLYAFSTDPDSGCIVHSACAATLHCPSKQSWLLIQRLSAGQAEQAEWQGSLRYCFRKSPKGTALKWEEEEKRLGMVPALYKVLKGTGYQLCIFCTNVRQNMHTKVVHEETALLHCPFSLLKLLRCTSLRTETLNY